ncbi:MULTISPECIES: DUF6381 family protein [Streptomyces]|uniref:Small hydrophilic protein n=2 Tax=Streptomyces TaxID=1883 RepID=A0A0B5EQ37_STRA4|nr:MULTISPECIES: DUF6381 family protein [Streptomyces]AJE81385.1 small hydrophilic protein [Streptomyces albus]AOU75701.1 small hydrophilic protein [Streptomyces albus]NKI45132.1 small hydrophilic protein [Streptomyces physcomitrii]
MSVADEPGARAAQMRQKAQELREAAERSSDPEARERLENKARHLQEQSEKTDRPGPGEARPMG